MDKDLINKIIQLKEGNRIRINGEIFSIKEKNVHKGTCDDDPDSITLELENDYFLFYEEHFLVFYKRMNGKNSSTVKEIPIKKIELI